MKVKNKLIKILIPLIAVVVVFESIVLVTNLDKNEVVVENVVEEKVVTEEPIIDFVFSTNVEEIKVGDTFKVDLSLLSSEDKMVDGIETYINYNLYGLEVAKLVSNSKLQEATLSEIDDEIGVIKNVILIDELEGLEIKAGELLPILTFEVTAKKEGSFDFELNSSIEGDGVASMVVENSIAKELPWVANKLEINVSK